MAGPFELCPGSRTLSQPHTWIWGPIRFPPGGCCKVLGGRWSLRGVTLLENLVPPCTSLLTTSRAETRTLPGRLDGRGHARLCRDNPVCSETLTWGSRTKGSGQGLGQALPPS